MRALEGVSANLFLYISIAITMTLETKLQAWFHIGPCTRDCMCFNLTDSEGLWRMTFSKTLCDVEADERGRLHSLITVRLSVLSCSIRINSFCQLFPRVYLKISHLLILYDPYTLVSRPRDTRVKESSLILDLL